MAIYVEIPAASRTKECVKMRFRALAALAVSGGSEGVAIVGCGEVNGLRRERRRAFRAERHISLATCILHSHS
jgi:hypothetical protein